MADFDQESWERRWEQALREHADVVASRPPSPYVAVELADLPPGRALDAGCGHGAESIWLAVQGWQVTAVDFSLAAVEQGRRTAHALGPELADRISWLTEDLGTWVPEPAAYDLVSCLYVHVADSVEAMVRRLAGAVAPGGTLLLVGHRPVDPATGAPTPAAGQTQVSVEEALVVLAEDSWEVLVAEERPREQAGSGVDAVVRARRTGSPR